MNARHPCNAICDAPYWNDSQNERDENQEWIDTVTAARELAFDAIKANARQNRENFNKNANPQEYEVDDLVFVKTKYDANAVTGKLQPRYSGPFKIVELRDHRVLLRSINERQPVEVDVHRDKLRRCHEVVEEQMFQNVAPPRRGAGRPRKVPVTP